ncbi:DUF2752 domain-containing protein [Candidatus Pacearchaeota archaeon]|nr:DUF2752 domain-containing protein [Candidatus Pacearchaeota archaeon]
MATLFFLPAQYLQKSSFHCIFKTYILPLFFNGNCPTTGFFANCDCPACGLTHAAQALVHGNFQQALAYNLLVLPLFIVFFSLIVINLLKIMKKFK